jgi:hypothetical protein
MAVEGEFSRLFAIECLSYVRIAGIYVTVRGYMKCTKLWNYATIIGGALIATLILRSAFIESYKIIS